MLDDQKLLALFALFMLVIALLMLKARSRIGLPDVKMNWTNMPAIVGLGLATGTLSGFFGMGGGLIDTRFARLLSARRGALNTVFAAVIIVVALYMLARYLGVS